MHLIFLSQKVLVARWDRTPKRFAKHATDHQTDTGYLPSVFITYYILERGPEGVGGEN